MPSQSLNSKKKKDQTISKQLVSSIVHKPFATGTINIFNPYRNKKKGDLSPPKLFLNDELGQELEQSEATKKSAINPELEPVAIEYRTKNWLDSLLSPWGISAIAILFFANLISAGVIWRNTRATESSKNHAVSAVGNTNLSAQEFIPLNLSTLSMIKPHEDISLAESQPKITPINPALAPLSDLTDLSAINTPYYYVLAEYQGDESLSLARKKVKQISLANLPQGVFIYLGAFGDRQQADKFVAQLQQEELKANVYPLD